MFQQFRRAALCVGVAVSAILTGCASQAPNYAPSIDNVEVLKQIGVGTTVKTGTIGVTPDTSGAQSIGLRGSKMVSPIGDNYGDYIAAALRQELELAKLYNPQSGVEISGTLIENDINTKGFSTGSGEIEARFLVTAKGQVRFDKIKRIERQWESSFIGAVAIPRAMSNYPLMVQSLVSSLAADPDFVKALRN